MKRTWGPREAKIVAARQNWCCAHCQKLLPSTFELDHVVALHLGGSNDFETNSAALCNGCHAIKTQKEMIALMKVRTEAKRVADEERLRAIENARLEDPIPEVAQRSPIVKKPRKRHPSPAPGDDDFSDALLSDNPFLRYSYTGPPGRRGRG